MNLQTVMNPSRVGLHRGGLDRRAARLTSTRSRRRLATGLRRVIEAAEKPPAVFSSSAPVRRREVLSARARILELAEHLETSAAVSPRGVALVERLLTDVASPLYTPHPAGSLEADLGHARAALLLAP